MELLDQNFGSAKKINFKKEVFRFMKYWPWIVLSMVICYAVAYFYLKYTQPQYLSKTTLLFQETKNDKGALSDLKNLGMGISDDGELQGEAAIIISKPIITKVVKNLNLDVQFLAIGKIREVELYNLSPYFGKILEAGKSFGGATYYIEPVNDNSFRLTEGPLVGSNNVFHYGEMITLPWGKVSITRNPNGYKPYRNFIIFKSSSSAEKQLESSLNVQLPNGLLMDISMVGAVPKKSEDILNELSKQYNLDGISDKNAEAENTAKFIDERLDLISKDLGNIELDKENFKKANKLTDLDVQAEIAVNRLTGNVETIYNQSARLQILNEMYDVAVSGKEQLFPTGLGMPESLEALLKQYNDIVLLKKRTLNQATAANPSIKAFEKQLAEIKALIRDNIQQSRAELQKNIGQTNQEIGEDKGSILKYPTQERIFRNIERQRNLKESLYLYLLQKREENAITLAVTTPKTKLVNPAYTIGVVKPNYSQVKIGALALGLVLPLLIIFIKNILDTKVRSKDDIESIVSNIPIISEVPHSDSTIPLIEKNDFTVFAESFRILTSNLKFILRAKSIQKGGVILVTSSVKGEGKTTISTNTAVSLAGGGKVLLIGADIRNPQLHRYMTERRKGLTDYLISDNEPIDDYIIKSGLSDNLDVIFSGAKAPNPNDLLDMKKFDLMIDELKKDYDYIVLDSAPVMLVSDSLHLVDVSDLVVYTVKSEFTEKEMIMFASNFKNENAVNNMVFVLNNVQPEYSRYGYKYGYGYYSYQQPKNKLMKLFSRKKNQ
ncbi:capsular exopolysaccharide synthesis family protein [Epilithonimonas hungarica]|uniref:GumC family protein n=1 Tax=Epilithonimonas hungarica TaxID=454006 RepID=UPI00277DD023|nr:polysaccharide biosynthesis tyrosine autokinase [Epilithonimonas hungarica]MDP9956835.1 capsular exopolysaccharide synthesis family protein [Epilithonimonas hungarica]